MDEICKRLDTICKFINNGRPLLTPQSSPANLQSAYDAMEATPVSSLTASALIEPKEPGVRDHKSPEPEYEGESALSVHTAFATRFLQTAVNIDHSAPIPPEAATALCNLQRNVETPPREAESPRDQLPNAGLSKRHTGVSALSMPPAQIALACLRMAKGSDGPLE